MNEMTMAVFEDSLQHWGVLGMRWGVRRYQPYGTGYDLLHEGKNIGLAARLAGRTGSYSDAVRRGSSIGAKAKYAVGTAAKKAKSSIKGLGSEIASFTGDVRTDLSRYGSRISSKMMDAMRTTKASAKSLGTKSALIGSFILGALDPTSSASQIIDASYRNKPNKNVARGSTGMSGDIFGDILGSLRERPALASRLGGSDPSTSVGKALAKEIGLKNFINYDYRKYTPDLAKKTEQWHQLNERYANIEAYETYGGISDKTLQKITSRKGFTLTPAFTRMDELASHNESRNQFARDFIDRQMKNGTLMTWDTKYTLFNEATRKELEKQLLGL